MDEFFNDIKFLTSFIGCNIFDVVKPQDKHLFYATARGCNAIGFYDGSGFTVHKDSIIANDTTTSFTWKDKRKELIKEYTKENSGKYILDSDKTDQCKNPVD